MSYYRQSGIGLHTPVRVSYRETLGDDLGGTFAGFPAQNIANYLGVSLIQAEGIINMANGAPVTPEQAAALSSFSQTRFNNVQGGMQHLAEHPMGSHYHGGIGNLVKNIALNFATGGLYSIAKAAVNVAQGGKVIEQAKTALASQGIAGGILQPAIGTNKTLAIEAAIAGGALAAPLAAAVGPGVAGVASLVGGKVVQMVTADKPGASPSQAPQTPTAQIDPRTGLPIPPGTDPRYDPGYSNLAPWTPSGSPTADFGPNLTQPTADAGLFGGMSPLMLIGLFGVPLLIQVFMKKGR